MTVKEAKLFIDPETSGKVTENYYPNYWDWRDAYREACEIAAEVMDKAIAREVERSVETARCPRCTAAILTPWEPYCSICGQKLEWEEM